MKKRTVWILCLLAALLLVLPAVVFVKLSRGQPQPEIAVETSKVPEAEKKVNDELLPSEENKTEEKEPEQTLPPMPEVGRVTGTGGMSGASGASGGGSSSGGGSAGAASLAEEWISSDVPVIGGEESVINYVQAESSGTSGGTSAQTASSGQTASATDTSATAGDETPPVGADAETDGTGAYPGADHELDNSHLRENETPLA